MTSRPAQSLLVELNSFIGRERDLAELSRLVADARLVTVTGPGGIGKSRLASRFASLTSANFDGVFHVQLAPTSDPDLVVHAVASTLAIRGEPGRTILETLTARLGQGRFLIVLDNCERVLDGVAPLARALLEGCPELWVLATSREPLNVPGEALHVVHGLPQAEAVALFVDRARQVQPTFGRAQVIPGLADVCRQLDGMPLAIELAAVHARSMPPAEMLIHLDDRFKLLVTPGRIDPRHATLKATIDWSYELLTEEERTVFRNLAIFPASFDLATAAAVCERDLIPLLSRLVEESMVVSSTDGHESGRYHLLDTIRHYGRDRLEEAGEREAAEQRFIAHFVATCDVEVARLAAAEQSSWLARTERDYESLRGVLALTRAREPATMLRLGATLAWFWFVRGYWAEGLDWVEAALAASTEHSSARARLLSGAVDLARYLNRYSDGRRYGDEALRLYGEQGDGAGRAETLFRVGWLAMPNQRFDEAESCFQEVMRMARQLDSAPLMMRAFLGLGQVRWRLGKSRESLRLLLQGQATAQSLDDERTLMLFSDTLGHVLHDLGRLNDARRHFAESHDAAHRLGDRYHAAHTLLNIAFVDLKRGDDAAIAASLEASLRTFAELGQRVDVSLSLDGLALLATEQRDYQRALRLFAAAGGIRRSIGAGWSAAHHARVKAAIARCHEALPAPRARQAWREGESMTVEQALKSVLAKEPPAVVELSRRERAIAALIGEGLTSAQIASRLKIAERTVDSHAEHIRNKLGLHSRAQIAAWAVRELLATRSG